LSHPLVALVTTLSVFAEGTADNQTWLPWLPGVLSEKYAEAEETLNSQMAALQQMRLMLGLH
jgi:hypothetical protein